MNVSMTAGIFAMALATMCGQALAQGVQENESDMQFLNRMQSRLSEVERRAEYLDDFAQEKMGMANASENRMGVATQGMPTPAGSRDRTSQSPVDQEFRTIRLKLRSLKKKIKKERERMVEQASSDDGLDRDHAEAVVSRLEHEIYELNRDLRRL